MEFLTTINRKNVRYYEPFLPVSVREAYLEDENLLLYGIDEDDTACGAMAVRVLKPEAELTWIFLAEDYRGRGIATSAVTDLSGLLRADDYAELYTNLPPGAQGAALSNLFSSFPLTYEENDAAVVYTTVSELQKVKELDLPPKGSVSLKEVTGGALKKLEQAIRESNDDLVNFPIRREDYLEDLSAVYMDGKEPAGILLARKSPHRIITLSFIYTVSPNPEGVLDMMRFFLNGAKNLPGMGYIRMNMVNPELLDYLSKRAHVEVQRSLRPVIDLSWIDGVYEEAERRLTEA